MGRFIARRLIGMVAVLFAISVIVFLIFNVIPNSDPAARIAGKNANPELIARVQDDLGLDEPLPVQYVTMMQQIFTGELTSYTRDQNVDEQIIEGLPATISLCVGAAILWMSLAICFGYLSAVRAGLFTDRALTILALVGISMPVFWIGARSFSARSTASMIFPNAVSLPIPVTRTSSAPDWLIVPAKTSAPSAFSRGNDSPVIVDWSTDECPATTTPSIGSREPGFTSTTSPT